MSRRDHKLLCPRTLTRGTTPVKYEQSMNNHKVVRPMCLPRFSLDYGVYI